MGEALGLTEGEYEVFTELQLAAFSVPLECRQYVIIRSGVVLYSDH